ncbi:MAG TPA: ABC transporter ATP-binding protein [Gaiellaceae bacterium]|nr:ABC transporter ATP-binding protein [Gaiellaceae bacterium]
MPTTLTPSGQDRSKPSSVADPLVRVDDLSVHFPVGRAGFWGQRKLYLHAVESISFAIRPGETLGLVGESGSGKTTTGRAILRKVPITAGSVEFGGEDITHVKGEQLRRLRKRMQLVFQDPYASLNPRQRILDIVAEPLLVHGTISRIQQGRDRVAELLELVGLPVDVMYRYPYAFSGGQRQRVGIARALSLEPDFIVADEPVSALDVSIRAQVVNLLQDLQERLGLTYLFIAHDLSVVRHISHRIAVMYAGKIVETGTRDDIYERPKHPYTEALLSAVPIPDPKAELDRSRIVLSGAFPNLIDPPTGCRFHTRCPLATDRCRVEEPPFAERASGHLAACWNT